MLLGWVVLCVYSLLLVPSDHRSAMRCSVGWSHGLLPSLALCIARQKLAQNAASPVVHLTEISFALRFFTDERKIALRGDERVLVKPFHRWRGPAQLSN